MMCFTLGMRPHMGGEGWWDSSVCLLATVPPIPTVSSTAPLIAAVWMTVVLHGFRCLTPMLTIVAAMGYGRPIFGSPPDKRDEANAAKKQLTAASAAAKSDHLAIIAAFNTWNRARLKGGRHEAAMASPHSHPLVLYLQPLARQTRVLGAALLRECDLN